MKIKRLIYMDDIKIFAKNFGKLKTFMQMVRVYRQNIRMKFGIENVP